MGTAVSASDAVRREGMVNGVRIDFFYHRNDVETKKLSYSPRSEHLEPNFAHGEAEGQSDPTDIPNLDVIAVIPVHADQPDDYAILRVKRSDTDPQGDLPTFNTVIASGLPTQYIQDFSPSGLSCWQTRSSSTPKETNLHVIISKGSGLKQAEAFFASAVRPLWSHFALSEGEGAMSYAVHSTSSEDSVTEVTERILLPQANKGNSQAVVLLSGDGGVVDIVNALHHGTRSSRYVKPNVALLPFGTGNALAHSLGITADDTRGLATMIRGHHQPLPLMRVTFSKGARVVYDEGRKTRELPQTNGIPTIWGAVVCSWGLHASLVADSDTTEYRKFGAERFQMAAKAALFPEDGSVPHHYRGEVSIQRDSQSEAWELVERESHAYVLATLVSNLEKGFTISPESKPLDGRLRLVHFGPMSGDDAMKVMGNAYQGGKHVEDKRVGYEDIEALRIKFGEEEDPAWRRICVDGKIIVVEKGGWVEVAKELENVADIVCMDPQESATSKGSFATPTVS